MTLPTGVTIIAGTGTLTGAGLAAGFASRTAAPWHGRGLQGVATVISPTVMVLLPG